jgi:hypothetical protein
MERKNGGEMERFIFRKNICLSFILCVFSFLFCCHTLNKIDSNITEYYNFEVEENLNVTICKIAGDDSELEYIYKKTSSSKVASMIETHYSLYGKKYSLPSYFKNKNLSYNYSIMPNYYTGNSKFIVAKKIVIENSIIYIIRGENPECNGNNCKTYFLHFLIIKGKVIVANYLYYLSEDSDCFDLMTVKQKNKMFLLMNNNCIIDKLPVGAGLQPVP